MTTESAGAPDRAAVLDAAQYAQVLASFIDAAVAKEHARDPDPALTDAYRRLLQARAQANGEVIDCFQTASIEKIVLRWLLLASIKWDPVGVVFEPFGGDTVAVMRARGEAYTQLGVPAGAAGAGDAVDTAFARELASRQRWFDTARTVHVSLQPATTELVIDGQPFRPDLYFWSPAVARFAMVVECAGFQPHAAPAVPPVALTADVTALRLAGIDMFRDPVGAVLQVLRTLEQALAEGCRAHRG